MSELKYGDKVKNIAASESNPIKYGMFVRHLHGSEAEYVTHLGVHHTPIDNLLYLPLTPALTLAKEALERVDEAITGLSFGVDWNNGTAAKKHGYRKKLLDALPDVKSALAAIKQMEG